MEKFRFCLANFSVPDFGRCQVSSPRYSWKKTWAHQYPHRRIHVIPPFNQRTGRTQSAGQRSRTRPSGLTQLAAGGTTQQRQPWSITPQREMDPGDSLSLQLQKLHLQIRESQPQMMTLVNTENKYFFKKNPENSGVLNVPDTRGKNLLNMSLSVSESRRVWSPTAPMTFWRATRLRSMACRSPSAAVTVGARGFVTRGLSLWGVYSILGWCQFSWQVFCTEFFQPWF